MKRSFITHRRSFMLNLFFQVILLMMFAGRAFAAGPSTRPYVLHLPGVDGGANLDRSFLAGLKDGGLDADYRMYDWTGNAKGIAALHAYEHNQQEAGRVADGIVERLHKYPNDRIIITGHSGGCAVAIWTLEQLPKDIQVNSVLLLAPAISPDYDLSRALAHVDGKVSAFTSTGDELVLGIGCRVCGTMDGKMTDAAGRVGFTRPPSADPLQYAKLDQRPYDQQWGWLGNYGDHIGPMSRPFAAKILTPLIVGP